jgi:dipeptidyl aminopeptidase/acylaminoacyl peptidase
LFCGSPAWAQSRFDLSIPNIMRGPELYGRAPGNVQWTADGRWIYFQWLEPGARWDEPTRPFRVNADGSSPPERVTAAHADSAAPLLADGPRAPSGNARVVSALGDLFIIDAESPAPRRLTQTAAAEGTPRWSADGSLIFYQRDANAWSVDVRTGLTRQLTDVRAGPAPRDSAAPLGQRGALAQDQRDLLQTVRDRLRRDSIVRTERDQRDAAAALKPAYLAAGERAVTIEVAPSGRHAIIVAERPATSTRRADVPAYVTSDGFTTLLPARTKVGDEQNVRRAGLLDLSAGSITWLRATPADTARTPSQLNVIGWNDSGTRAALFSVTYDFKTRYIHTVGTDGRLALVDELRDSAWTSGPCFGCAGWIDDATVWYASEASGYAHLYSARADGGNKTALTSGSWEVLGAQLSPDRSAFLMHTSEESPYVRHFYRMPVSGGTRARVTTARGSHNVVLAPDGVRYADVHSTSNRPPELFVGRVGTPAITQRTTSPTPEWLAGPWIKPEIIEIPASDGVKVPARIYEPRSLNARPNGAAVIFVHGAGYLHNVHDYWSSYAREYMFHHLLASRGYVVLDIDYRASAGYGRDWRTAIYRWMGGRDLADHVDASKWLTANRRIPPNRIGIYGGSYGGFITLMALFTAPDYFGAGAALRPVTDWAHYNHGYTGRILNFPQDDTTSYRRSSPIFFAEGLNDPLLIAHGMVDVNVHYQDVVRLTQRLIELGKTDWELASYPVENHGFTRPSSWADEYRRIFELFERTLR